MAAGLMAATIARQIVEARGWGHARCQPFGLTQERILVGERWLGINTSLYDTTVELFAGRWIAGGRPTDPEAQSGPLDGTEPEQLVAAVEKLWQRLDTAKHL
ncbi:hypothetical protein [Streptomyces sp. x-80]|uniref:hypothetical protein n=1 Tax=Streptomyces sp. x-80 TaxID=2789282 RepID=UPI00397EE55D